MIFLAFSVYTHLLWQGQCILWIWACFQGQQPYQRESCSFVSRIIFLLWIFWQIIIIKVPALSPKSRFFSCCLIFWKWFYRVQSPIQWKHKSQSFHWLAPFHVILINDENNLNNKFLLAHWIVNERFFSSIWIGNWEYL